MQERLSGIKNGIADNRKHTPPHTLFLRVLDEKWWKICPRRALGSLACRRLQLPGMLHEQTVSPRSGKLFCALDVHERVWTDRLIKRSISLCCVGFFFGRYQIEEERRKKKTFYGYIISSRCDWNRYTQCLLNRSLSPVRGERKRCAICGWAPDIYLSHIIAPYTSPKSALLISSLNAATKAKCMCVRALLSAFPHERRAKLVSVEGSWTRWFEKDAEGSPQF